MHQGGQKQLLAPEAAHDRAEPRSDIPTWDLQDLYAGLDDPRIDQHLAAAEAEATAFQSSLAGRLAQVNAGELAAAIETYQRIEEQLGRLTSYAQLRYAASTDDPAVGQFYQRISERVTDITSRLLFLTLEINRIGDAEFTALVGQSALHRWRSWLQDLRVFRPHQLSDDLERLLHEKDVTDRAWLRLFDETISAMRIQVGADSLTVTAALNHLSDRNRSMREAAAHGIEAAFGGNVRLFSLITNTLAKDKHTVDTWRQYPQPASYRNRSNMVEDEVVEALVTAVTSDYPRLSHRYYALKARWLGLPKLQHWDRNAPLPEDEDGSISWPQARDRVLSAYAAFSPRLADVGRRFFDQGWIDAELRTGKASGAFAHPTVPSVHPYILMNYHGRTRDVMTLAHELGHGVHQILAAEQGYLLSQTPLTLAETASVFGEMLTFRALLDAEPDPRRRRIMLAAKVEDMLNTVVRQVAFYRFETLVHMERRRGELLPDRINEIWLSVQRESLGPAFEFTPEYGVFWSYVPHFIHSPFYVYAYAFGDCLVNALYDLFQHGHPDFQAKYLDMLRAGGTKRHKQLLEPFGLDASDPGFWTRGLDVIAGFIDELEAIS